MATSVGVRELRNNLTGFLRRVRAGETIEVTSHGEPVAVLAPPPEPKRDRYDEMVAQGRIKPAKVPFGTYGPPRLKNTTGIPTEQILDELRKDFWEP